MKELGQTEIKKVIKEWVSKLDGIDVFNVASGYDSFKNWADGKRCECYSNYQEIVKQADGIVLKLALKSI